MGKRGGGGLESSNREQTGITTFPHAICTVRTKHGCVNVYILCSRISSQSPFFLVLFIRHCSAQGRQQKGLSKWIVVVVQYSRQ